MTAPTETTTPTTDARNKATRFWDRVAAKYARRPIKDVEAYEKTMARTRAYLAPDQQVLEIGCGTGSTALLLASQVGHLTATDISPRMIEIARGKIADHKATNVRFEAATVFDAPLAPGGHDVILAYNFLHLVEDLPATLRRIHALLKPDGLFISKTVCLAERGFYLRPLIALMQMVGRAPYVDFVSIEEIDAAITRAGFEIGETGLYPPSAPSRFVVARKISDAAV